jgi:hypothetical protein
VFVSDIKFTPQLLLEAKLSLLIFAHDAIAQRANAGHL